MPPITRLDRPMNYRDYRKEITIVWDMDQEVATDDTKDLFHLAIWTAQQTTPGNGEGPITSVEIVFHSGLIWHLCADDNLDEEHENFMSQIDDEVTEL